MTYKKIPWPSDLPRSKEHNNPPFSIPGVHLPEISVHEDIVDAAMHKELWDYLNNQLWYNAWSGVEPEMQIYRPNEWDDSWINAVSNRTTLEMPRCLFASDEASLQKKHALVWKLWEHINARLGNKYEIAGNPEGVAWNSYPCPPTQDPSLKQGWRVYANATPHDMISIGGHAHRDTPDLNDDTTATMVWIANPEWYPSWGGELMFYPEDPTGATGDHQQFGQGRWHQRRNFNIGWPDEGKIVCMKPNRLIAWDGRALHTVTPTRHRYNTIPNRRIAFRTRLKKS